MVDNFAACGLIDTVQLKPFALNKATRVEYNFNGLSDPAIEMLFGIPDPVVLACRDPYGPHVKQEERDSECFDVHPALDEADNLMQRRASRMDPCPTSSPGIAR